MQNNVWLICKYASPKKYFFGTRHFSFAKEWVKRDHDVTIFTSNSSHMTSGLPQFKGSHWVEQIDGIRTIWLNVPSSQKSNGLKRVLSWFYFELRVFQVSKKQLPDPDVIIVSSLSLFSVWSGLFYSWKYKARFILEIRDIWPLSGMELANLSKWNPLIILMHITEYLGYKYAKRIVGTMPNLKEHVAQVSPNNSEKVICIPQCYDWDFFNEEQEKLPEEIVKKYFSKQRFRVFYTGAISHNNPLDLIIEAVEELDLDLYIVGSGARKAKLMLKYKTIENVFFLEPVKKSEVQHLLSFANVCYDSISGGIGRYGLSRNKWIDYMMSKSPIVCAFDGFQSMINESESGFFVPYDDLEKLKFTLLRLKNDPDLERSMGERGYRWLIENRSAEKLANQYSEIFLK